MSATGAPTLIGGGGSRVRLAGVGAQHMVLVPVSFAGPTSYDTGGSVLTLPTSDVRGMELKGVIILSGAAVTVDREYAWNGDTAAPKIVARVISTAAQVAGATNLSADTIKALLLYGG